MATTQSLQIQAESCAEASCVVCGTSEKIMRCANCQSVSYCSKEHQRQDWKRHKKDCKRTKSQTRATKTASIDQSDNRSSSPINTSLKNKAKANCEKSPENKAIDLSFEFDKRPYRSIDFAQPAAKDLDSLALHVTTQLKEKNYCVVNDVFNLKMSDAVVKEVIALHSTGIFIDGQLSGGRTSSSASEIVTKKAIRGDKIAWLQGNEKEYPWISFLVKTLDGLVSRMNPYLKGHCEVGGRTKAMVACYPGNGTGYACHVDNPNRDGRCITVLYYLNEGWDAKESGGLLRLFSASGDYADVEPILNRAIFFWSDRRNPHEVQPAFKTRYAITVWYLDKTERQEAKEAVESGASQDISSLQQQYAKMDLMSKQAEKDELEHHIQEQARSALDSLTEEELQSILIMIGQEPDPKDVLAHMNIPPEIQVALLARLTKRSRTGQPAT